jgi:hypothetical protein
LRVMPEATSRAPSARRTWSVRSQASRPARLRSLAGRIWSGHRLFVIVLIPAVLLRADAELGYRWQAWFNDSFVYVEDTIHFNLDPTRVSGYSVWLKILEPLHSYAIVTILQHLMGLAVAVMIYALARHRFGASAWLATLAAVPVLYDGYEIQLEHLILSDVPFLFVLMLATTLLLWDPDGPSTRRSAVIGLLLGLGAVLRSIGLPLLAIFAVYMIIKRFSWRRIVAAVGMCLIPVFAYAGAFDLEHGQFAMSDATGIFLYSRVMTFADCAKIHPPVSELWLCTVQPSDQRPIAQDQIWRSTSHTPLDRYPPTKFAPTPNQYAEDFAIRAIEAQPAAYAKAVLGDTWRVFDWKRQVFPNAQTYDEYQFLATAPPIPSWDDAKIGRFNSFSATYLRGNPETQVVNPFAVIIRDYQKYVWLPGTLYGLILLAGLAGIAAAWRRLGGDALLPWAVSAAMVVVPAATAEFDYRYVLPATPFACLAAVMAFSRGTAGRAGLRDLADAVRRTAGASRTAPGSGTASVSRTTPGSGTAAGTVADSGAGSVADSGADSGSASAAAGAGDDQRNLATDGA